MLLISFSSLSHILYQLWDITMQNLQIPLRKIKTKEQRAGRDPLCLGAQTPLAPGHITQCLSSAVRTPSYNPSCAPILALDVCSLQHWLLNWLHNVFQLPVKIHSWAVYAHLFLCQHCTLSSKDLFLPWCLTSWCIYRKQWHYVSAFVLLH